MSASVDADVMRVLESKMAGDDMVRRQDFANLAMCILSTVEDAVVAPLRERLDRAEERVDQLEHDLLVR